MAAYHLFSLSRNIAASHGFLCPNTFQENLRKSGQVMTLRLSVPKQSHGADVDDLSYAGRGHHWEATMSFRQREIPRFF